MFDTKNVLSHLSITVSKTTVYKTGNPVTSI